MKVKVGTKTDWADAKAIVLCARMGIANVAAAEGSTRAHLIASVLRTVAAGAYQRGYDKGIDVACDENLHD